MITIAVVYVIGILGMAYLFGRLGEVDYAGYALLWPFFLLACAIVLPIEAFGKLGRRHRRKARGRHYD